MQTWEDFKMKDDRELSGAEGNAQEVTKVMAMADMVIENDGSLEELYANLDQMIAKRE